VPHLNDISGDHSGSLWLKSIRGDVVVLAWLYPRATHWILDRLGIKGRTGTVLLRSGEEDEEEEQAESDEAPTGIGAIKAINVPDRSVFALDLRIEAKPEVFLTEIRRIAREASVDVQPITLTGLGLGNGLSVLPSAAPPAPAAAPVAHLGDVRRRWFPVIDYDRCTNCMECIDFCLFGVYGLDDHERILVEQQDNCKKGCPACSRVCPANAIIFPEHKTPSIAGSPVSAAGDFKIDGRGRP
jgi:NAD-dependent dihydropyrimidine dehydrogenase PreA subunit